MKPSANKIVHPCNLMLGVLLYQTSTFVSPLIISTAFRNKRFHLYVPDANKKNFISRKYGTNYQSVMNAVFDDDGEISDESPLQKQGPIPTNSFYQDSDCIDLCDTENIQGLVENIDLVESFLVPSKSDGPITRHISPNQMLKNIELRWSIEESNNDCDVDNLSSCSEPCIQCRGEGTAECTFCNGSGYIDMGPQDPGTMGDQLVRRNGGVTGIECPVCNENGDQICSKCMGSGWIARWRMNLTDIVHP